MTLLTWKSKGTPKKPFSGSDFETDQSISPGNLRWERPWVSLIAWVCLSGPLKWRRPLGCSFENHRGHPKNTDLRRHGEFATLETKGRDRRRGAWLPREPHLETRPWAPRAAFQRPPRRLKGPVPSGSVKIDRGTLQKWWTVISPPNSNVQRPPRVIPTSTSPKAMPSFIGRLDWA